MTLHIFTSEEEENVFEIESHREKPKQIKPIDRIFQVDPSIEALETPNLNMNPLDLIYPIAIINVRHRAIARVAALIKRETIVTDVT